MSFDGLIVKGERAKVNNWILKLRHPSGFMNARLDSPTSMKAGDPDHIINRLPSPKGRLQARQLPATISGWWTAKKLFWPALADDRQARGGTNSHAQARDSRFFGRWVRVKLPVSGRSFFNGKF